MNLLQVYEGEGQPLWRCPHWSDVETRPLRPLMSILVLTARHAPGTPLIIWMSSCSSSPQPPPPSLLISPVLPSPSQPSFPPHRPSRVRGGSARAGAGSRVRGPGGVQEEEGQPVAWVTHSGRGGSSACAAPRAPPCCSCAANSWPPPATSGPTKTSSGCW